MQRTVTKSALSPDRQWLVELMQEVNHGRIKNLTVRDGEPVRDPAPEILRTCKFGGDNGPHAARGGCQDFTLKKEVTELLEILDSQQSCVIDELVVVDGLPVRMTIRVSMPI